MLYQFFDCFTILRYFDLYHTKFILNILLNFLECDKMIYIILSALGLVSNYKEVTEAHIPIRLTYKIKSEHWAMRIYTLYSIYYLYTTGPSSPKYPLKPTNVYLFRTHVGTC